MPPLISLRYNPGKLREGNVIIGKPEEAKYGFTREQLFEGYRILRDRGVKRFGLHAMIVSNELNVDYHVETARLLFDLMAEISAELGIRFELVNLGGGFGIPYKPEQTAIDWKALGTGIRDVYETKVKARGLHPLRLCMESGRAIMGPYGWLVSTGAAPEAHLQGLRRPGCVHGQPHAARPVRRVSPHHGHGQGDGSPPIVSTTSPVRCARTTTSSPSTGSCPAIDGG